MSDYLTDEEQLDKLRGWWQQNGLMLACAVIVSVIGVVGWRWYAEYRADQVAGASDLYVDYLTAEGTERDSIATTLAREYPESIYQVLVLLRESQERIIAEDVEGAEMQLKKALSAASDDKLADIVRLRLARVLQQLERTDEALSTLGQVSSLGMRSQVQELKGDIHMVRGEREAAHEAYAAALTEAGEGAQRPILEMKVADTADTNDA